MLKIFMQKDSDVIKIDLQCFVQGDVVLECVHLDLEPEREVMMFRIMFNTAFIRSNILMLNAENLDILWDSKARFPKGFRAEVIFIFLVEKIQFVIKLHKSTIRFITFQEYLICKGRCYLEMLRAAPPPMPTLQC